MLFQAAQEVKEVIQSVSPRVVVLELDEVIRPGFSHLSHAGFMLAFGDIWVQCITTCMSAPVCRRDIKGCSRQLLPVMTMASRGTCSMGHCRFLYVHKLSIVTHACRKAPAGQFA